MPTRSAHVWPGVLFLILGYYWMISILRRYMTSRAKGTEFKATASFLLPCRLPKLGHVPWEGVVKAIAAFAGFCTEAPKHLPHPNTMSYLHSTLYYNFIISGIVDIISHYTDALPAGSDYVSLILAFSMEWALLYYHLDGRKVLDVRVHTFLTHCIIMTVIMLIVEAKYKNSVVVALSRAYALIIQGSWWVAAGFILYDAHGMANPKWDMTSHENGVLVTIYFCWHCGGHFLIALLLTISMYLWYRRSRGPFKDAPDSNRRQCNRDEYRRLTEQADTDDEFENTKMADLPSPDIRTRI